jgi:hypothetical protein
MDAPSRRRGVSRARRHRRRAVAETDGDRRLRANGIDLFEERSDPQSDAADALEPKAASPAPTSKRRWIGNGTQRNPTPLACALGGQHQALPRTETQTIDVGELPLRGERIEARRRTVARDDHRDPIRARGLDQ